MKLGDDDADVRGAARERPARHELRPARAVDPPEHRDRGPEDVEERIEALCASMHRFARYEPDCVLCLTGPAGGRGRGRGARGS